MIALPWLVFESCWTFKIYTQNISISCVESTSLNYPLIIDLDANEDNTCRAEWGVPLYVFVKYTRAKGGDAAAFLFI